MLRVRLATSTSVVSSTIVGLVSTDCHGCRRNRVKGTEGESSVFWGTGVL